ncbi:hypothetical protein N0V94_001277 [Neodidymelliopsis sp. IMI 364377]|nr:hypothetical protein N0V94_001277 [Neodidymelliopsis sp. IMI 364377]
MLRLKPSELTLTPDDVDETLRRMARRQPPNPSTAPAQRYPRNRWQPPPPRLRPGPQRSAGNAFIDLGNIPVLRPHPQQAVIAHVDDDEEPEETLTEPGERDETSINATVLPTQPSQFEPVSFPATTPPPRHSTRLPFRLGRHRGRTHQEASTLFKDQSDDSDGTLVDVTGPPMETTNVPGPSTPRRQRANTSEDTTPSPSPSLLASRSSTSAALRGGSGQPGKSRMRPIAQDATHAPPPLRQAQMPSPSHHLEASQDRATSEGKLSAVSYAKPIFK